MDPYAVMNPTPIELGQHDGNVHCLVFSPDGQRAISGGLDNNLMVWGTGEDPASWEFIRVLGNHSGQVRSISFSPDGLRAVSGGDCDNDNLDCVSPIKVWNVADPDPLQWAFVGELEGHDNGVVNSVSFAPDAQRVISGGRDSTIKIWNISGEDPEGWARLKEFHEDRSVLAVAFSPDGRRAISGTSSDGVRVWNVHGNPTEWAELKVLVHDLDWARTVSFSLDGLSAISASTSSQGTKIWNVAGNDPDEWLEIMMRDPPQSTSAVFSCNDQCFFAADTRGNVEVWNIGGEDSADWWKYGTFRGLPGDVFAVQPQTTSHTNLAMEV